MTDQPTTSHTNTEEASSADDVLAISFEDDGNAYNALTLLKELDSQGRVGLSEAVVVLRSQDGRLVEKDSIESTFLAGTAVGGLTGLLIGILGGPLGMLIGGAGGVYVGGLFDLHDVDETESALTLISRTVEVGHTAVLAVVTEQGPDVVDAAMSSLGGTVQRRTLTDVEAEIAAVDKAQRKATVEARKELLQARREQNTAAVKAKVAELKAHHQHRTTPASRGENIPAGTR